MSIYGDMGEWETAHADFVSSDGANASERALRRIAAAQRMGEIEARYETLPGGFQAEYARAKDHIKKIVDGMPPLTDEQLVRLAVLLS